MSGLPGGVNDPGAPTWAQPMTIATAARRVLRMQDTHDDVARVDLAAVAAIALVDQYMDRADDPLVPPAPQPVLDATVQVTIELYRRKDAPFGILGGFADVETGPVRIGADALKGVESLLSPYSHRYGVG